MKSFRSDALRVALDINTTEETYSTFFTERQFEYYANQGRCGLSMREAKERLQTIAEYRKEYNASSNGCEICTKEEPVHSIRCLGKGTQDAILFMTPGEATETSVYHVCKHMLREVDDCFDASDKLVWMMHFRNYSYSHILSNTTLTYHFAKWMNECFYERVSKIVLIDPPSYFYPIIYLGKSLVSQEIANKIQIIENNDTIETELSEYLTPEQLHIVLNGSVDNHASQQEEQV